MSNGAIATKIFKNTLFNRGFKDSPSYTAYTRGSIGTGTTTPVEGDSALAAVISGWNSGSDYKNYESNYPSFDESNKKVTVEMFIPTTLASGQTITEYADFNSDGTPRIGGRVVFTGIAKTPSIQIYLTATYSFV